MPPRLSLRPRQVLEEDRLGKRIGHVQFGLMGNEEIERLAEYEVISDRGYEQPGRTPVVNGVLDRRLGMLHMQCHASAHAMAMAMHV